LAPKLPPTLYSTIRTAMTGCSKAPWGLFVLRRVMRIFTHTTISPSLSLRQRPSRYAIRAGRNLPDKEFRYLRTVIVTAAIHQGFDSRLPPPPYRGSASTPRRRRDLKTRRFRHALRIRSALRPPHRLRPPRHGGGLTPPVNLLALGRRQPVYVAFRLGTDLCFW